MKANQIQLTIADLVAEAHDVHHPSQPASTTGAEDRGASSRRVVHARADPQVSLGWLEQALERNGGMHLVGHHTSYVDLSAFQVVEGLRYAFPRAMRAVAASVPRLVDLHDRVAASRASPRTSSPTARIPFNEDGIFRHYPELDLVSRGDGSRRLSTATKSADPTIDQITGKDSCPTCQTTSSGKCSPRAIHCPSKAPMKPSAIDPRQPTWL